MEWNECFPLKIYVHVHHLQCAQFLFVHFSGQLVGSFKELEGIHHKCNCSICVSRMATKVQCTDNLVSHSKTLFNLEYVGALVELPSHLPTQDDTEPHVFALK